MIEIVEHPTNVDCVCVKVTAPHEGAKAIFNSLLLTKYVRGEDYWVVPVVEFPLVKAKLEEANIHDGREISTEAWNRVSRYLAEQDRLNRIKKSSNDKALVAVLGVGNLKSELYSDQLTGVSFLLSGPRRALLDEMGLGKSISALTSFVVRKKLGLAERCLIICPNNVKQTWFKEIEKHTNLSAMDAGNGTRKLLENITTFAGSNHDILISHYDAVRIPKTKKLGKIEVLPDNLPVVVLGKVPIDCVIIDEIHLIKHLSAQRSVGVNYLVNNLKPSQKHLSWVLVEDDVGYQRWIRMDAKNLKIGENVEVPL